MDWLRIEQLVARYRDLPLGTVQRWVKEARRRSDAPLGHLRLVDPGHPRPEQRYALEEVGREDRPAAGQAAT